MEQLVLFWRENPCQAAEDIFGVELDNHQRVVVKSRWTHSSEIDILSRGTGKTFLGGLHAGLRGILYPGNRIGLIAPSFRQSKLLFSEVEKLYERSPLFQESLVRAPAKTADSCYCKFRAAEGQIGSYIEALPLGADGAKIRGSRFWEVIADEAAQIDPIVLNTVVRGFLATSQDPMANVRLMRELEASGLSLEEALKRTSSNKYILSSTAFFQWNHLWGRVSNFIETIYGAYKKKCRSGEDVSNYTFKGGPLNDGQIPYRLLSDGESCLTAFTYKDPSPGFMNVKTINKARQEMSDYEFRMEYEALFPADSEGFYRRSLLDASRRHAEFGPILTPRKGCLYALGLDPARSGDNFAISIYEIDPPEQDIRLGRVMSWNHKNFPLMASNVRKLIKHYGIRLLMMDAGGGGTTIRDLLASPENCPAGERLILEQDFPEHQFLEGDRILGPLVQFSNYDWVHDTNHNLKAALQNGRFKTAAVPPVAAHQQIWTPELDEADEEMERALVEWSSIIVVPAGSRMRWDTPSKHQRKDRYSAILIGFYAASILLQQQGHPQGLPSGFWA